LTLGANQNLEDAKRLQWNVKDFGKTTAGLSIIHLFVVQAASFLVFLSENRAVDFSC